MTPEFLTVEDVLTLHAGQVARFGGSAELRDIGMLESAVAQPCATFGGEWLHPDLFEMAAAYLFHLVENHPFVDGNKRAGLHAALLFLHINGYVVREPSPAFYELTMSVARGQMDKATVASTLRKLVAPA